MVRQATLPAYHSTPHTYILRNIQLTTRHTRVGEKFLQWSDQSPPDDEILDSVTLWWLTQSFPRSIYPYRQFFGAKPTFFHNDDAFYIKKPMGYSWHPQELAPTPVSLVAKVCGRSASGLSRNTTLLGKRRLTLCVSLDWKSSMAP